MQLLLKRAKIFMLGNKRFVAGPGGGAVSAPSWVADTGTYQNGIKDGSIISLTANARAQEAELAKAENREPDPVIEEEVPEQVSQAQKTKLPKGRVTAA